MKSSAKLLGAPLPQAGYPVKSKLPIILRAGAAASGPSIWADDFLTATALVHF